MLSSSLAWLRATTLALGLAASAGAFAANSYFLQIDGIKGESKDKTHADWIDIDSFSWGLTLAAPSGGADRGQATFSDFAWTQAVDRSTPPWFVNVATGKLVKQVTLDVTTSVLDGARVSFFQMVFNDVRGTGLAVQGNGGDALRASASMSSGTLVTMRYRPVDPKGAVGSWVVGSFNLQQGQPTALFSGDEAVLMGLFSAGGAISFDSRAVTAVPEPGQAALLLAGLAALGLLSRRRRR